METAKAIIKNICKFIQIYTKEFAQRNSYILTNHNINSNSAF